MSRTVTYDGKDYTLRLTRAGVRAAESQGLKASEMAETPFSSLGLLFFAALFSEHKVNPAKATTILDHVLDSGQAEMGEVFEELAEAYTELFGSGGSEK